MQTPYILSIPIVPTAWHNDEVQIIVDKIFTADEEDKLYLENQIDYMVYELYGLTEEEIRIVEGQTKVKQA